MADAPSTPDPQSVDPAYRPLMPRPEPANESQTSPLAAPVETSPAVAAESAALAAGVALEANLPAHVEEAAISDFMPLPWAPVMRMFGLGLALLIVLALGLLFAPVLQIVLLGFVFAFIFHAAARLLKGTMRDSYQLATITVYVLIVLVLGALIVGVATNLLSHFSSIRDTVDTAVQTLKAGQPLAQVSQSANETLSATGAADVFSVVQSLLRNLVGSLSLGLANIAGWVGTVVVSLLFAFLLQVGLYSGRNSFMAWVPKRSQRDVALLLSKLDRIWAGYLVAGVIFSSVLALLSFIQYELMGVPFPVILAIATGVLALIPSIGGLMATLLIFIVCLVLGSTTNPDMDHAVFALQVALINGLLTQGTYYFVGLPITGRGVRMPIAVVLIGSMAGLATQSLLVAWLTVPIIASMAALFTFMLAKVNGDDPFPNVQGSGDTGGFLHQLLNPSPEVFVRPEKPKQPTRRRGPLARLRFGRAPKAA